MSLEDDEINKAAEQASWKAVNLMRDFKKLPKEDQAVFFRGFLLQCIEDAPTKELVFARLQMALLCLAEGVSKRGFDARQMFRLALSEKSLPTK